MAKLTKAELKMFNNNCACHEACEKLVEKVVKHFEIASVERRIIWQKIVEKYKLDPNQVWQVNHSTGEIFVPTSEVLRDLNIEHVTMNVEKIYNTGKNKEKK